MRKRLSPGQQAQTTLGQRGTIQTAIGYSSFPWNTHPNDQRIRVVPTGPFDRAWAGVQKNNLISRVGTKRTSMIGPQPVYLQQLAASTQTIQRSNLASTAYGLGPASLTAVQQQYAQSGQLQSLKSMILGRLRGRR
ncbi:MAG: hypothetical protein ACREHG_04255 [Candidatus Saccharimonadales bacterium]